MKKLILSALLSTLFCQYVSATNEPAALAEEFSGLTDSSQLHNSQENSNTVPH